MKKTLLTLSAMAMVAAMTFISSCAKDGATGPTGPQGNTGPAGPTGATGATGIGAFALIGIAQPNNWNQVGTAGTAGARVYAQFNSPYLSFDSIGNGAVLVYDRGVTNLGVTSYAALTEIYYNSSGTQFTTEFNSNDGAVAVDVYNSLYTFTTFSSPDTFKIVVIPGAGKTSWPVDLSSYDAVNTYFKPRIVK